MMGRLRHQAAWIYYQRERERGCFERKNSSETGSAGWCEQLPKYKVGIHNSGLRCVLLSETRQPSWLSRVNLERFKWKMNCNYTVHRLSYHSVISLMKVTWKQDEMWKRKSMFPGRREYSHMSERADEGDKGIGVKPDITVRASASYGSCTSNIDSI